MKIAVLAGDGIGPEIMEQALVVLDALRLPQVTLWHGDVGGAGYRKHGHPLPPETLEMAKAADAILFGAVGDPACDGLERHLRPEQAILGLRQALTLFANLRPATLFPGLEAMSGLKPEIAREIDLLIVRELNGDVYFGEKAIRTLPDGRRQGYDFMSYAEDEVRRIAHLAFRAAQGRRKRLCSVDKANVLETSQLWREVVIEVAAEYPDVELSHMYVDNAAMQLVRAPKQFDVMVTENMFGDILSDCAAMLTGSIGMLPSASLDERGKGMYEPIHGSAPDIAGKNMANPLATILSVEMMLRYSLNEPTLADRVQAAVGAVLDQGLRTADIAAEGTRQVGTREMGDAVVAALRA